MPGQLKNTAKCPVCGDPLMGLVDQTRFTSIKGTWAVRRELFHERRAGAIRRRRRCVKFYVVYDEAQRERRALEVRAA